MSHDTHPMPISDDVLIRILDDEASEQERAAFRNLAGGHAAAARLWELRESAERFGDALASTPVLELPPMPTIPMPTTPIRRRWLEAKAATVALLLISGAAVAMPGTRAVTLDAAHTVVSWITGAEETPTEIQPVPGQATASFVPSGAVFLLTIESVQESGSVVLVRSQGADITARAAPDAELVVLPGELLIRNGGSNTDVLVSVPPTVTDIRLRIGGVLRPVSLEGGAARVVIPIR